MIRSALYCVIITTFCEALTPSGFKKTKFNEPEANKKYIPIDLFETFAAAVPFHRPSRHIIDHFKRDDKILRPPISFSYTNDQYTDGSEIDETQIQNFESKKQSAINNDKEEVISQNPENLYDHNHGVSDSGIYTESKISDSAELKDGEWHSGDERPKNVKPKKRKPKRKRKHRKRIEDETQEILNSHKNEKAKLPYLEEEVPPKREQNSNGRLHEEGYILGHPEDHYGAQGLLKTYVREEIDQAEQINDESTLNENIQHEPQPIENKHEDKTEHTDQVIDQTGPIAQHTSHEPHKAKHSPPKNTKFKKGGGKKHDSEHKATHGDKGEKTYKGHHEHEKGEHGHHDKEGHKGQYKDHGGQEKKHHEDHGYFGEKREKEVGEKGAEFKESGKHDKGHSTKGAHNIHKSEAFEKKQEFYDEYHESGNSEKHGGFHQEHKKAKGGHEKSHHLKGAHHDAKHGKKGKHEKGSEYREKKGHKKSGGHDTHYKHGEKYGKKGGKKVGKKWGYKDGDAKGR